jgi:hypothetical protein
MLITLRQLTWYTLIAKINNSVNYGYHLLCNENPRTPWEHLPQPPPSHPQPLTTNKFSVPCLSDKHKKMRCLIQSLQVQKIRFQKVQFATIRLKHTTRYWWFTRLPNDQCRHTHTQINTHKRSMQTHAFLCCNHIKCHMSSSSGICITASRSIASTTGSSPQMCFW